MKEYTYSIWATQGGGLVRDVNGTYIFIEKPDCPGLDAGDTMPEEWGVVPANWHARQEIVSEGPGRFPDEPPPSFVRRSS